MHQDEAYSIIVDLQQKLHSEYAMSASLDDEYNQNLTNNFNIEFLNQQISDKNHYSRIFFLIYYSKNHSLPFANSSVLLTNEVDCKNQTIDQNFYIYEVVNRSFFMTLLILAKADAINSILEDFITFSIIPSLYLMFLEQYSLECFCVLISELKSQYEENEISKPYHFIFSRSLFLSPFFLKFIRQNVHPFIQPFLDGANTNDSCQSNKHNLKHYQEKIIQSFRKNVGFIPSSIQLFLNKLNEDAPLFLKNCFFDPFLENPELYLVVDCSFTDDDETMKSVKNILRGLFSDEVISTISELIIQNEYSEMSYLVKDEKYNSHPMNFKKVINSFDLEFITTASNLIHQKSKAMKISLFGEKDKVIALYSSLFRSEKAEFHENLYKSSTYQREDCWMHFRKLLKDAPPLPVNYHPGKSKLTVKNFKEFMEDKLVETGDPSTDLKNIAVYKSFDKMFNECQQRILKKPSEFKNKMDNLYMIHTEQIEEMQKLSKSRKCLISIGKKKADIIETFQELFNTVLTRQLVEKDDLKGLNSIKIISDVVECNDRFNAYLKDKGKKSFELVGSKCYRIWYHRFYHNLSFANYLCYRTDLVKYDQAMKDIFCKFIQSIENTTAIKNSFIKKLLLKADIFEDDFVRLTQIFESNSDPLTKFDQLFYLTKDLYGSLKTLFQAIGEDYYTPFRILILAYVKPPHFLSNMIYFYEFLFHSKNSVISSDMIIPYQCTFEGFLIEVNSECLLNSNICYYLSRAHRRYVDVFICGKNPAVIVYLLNLLIDVSNGSISKEKSDSFLDEISNDPSKILNYHLNFTSYKCDKKIIDLFVDVVMNIHFGQKLDLSSADPKHLLKVVFFGYKKQKKIFKNTNVAQEINNVDFPNQSKIVVHEDDEEVDNIKEFVEGITTVHCSGVLEVIIEKIINPIKKSASKSKD